MYKPIVIATGVIIALGATSAGVAAAKLTDPQIAHIVVTADDGDIANAKQALQKESECRGAKVCAPNDRRSWFGQ